MMSDNSVRYLARVVIEFTTPFIIGGGNDSLADDVFVADANGLPLLPGSSIAGVLRHEYERLYPGRTDNIFGWQKGDNGQGSRLTVSSGCIHSCMNLPVEGRLSRQVITDDPVLCQSLKSIPRDHVRITGRGTAAETGKFDEKAVPAGNRFTFELMLEGSGEDVEQNNWNDLLNTFALPEFRVGGKSRRGFGAFRIHSVLANRFDLKKPEEYKAFCSYPTALSEPVTGTGLIPAASTASVTAIIAITPESFWMFGGGGSSDSADMNPVKESRIVWDAKGAGRVARPQFYIPGSSVKGALSHRTAFHYNALKKVYADSLEDQDSVTGEQNQAVKELFGYCKEGDDGRRGSILINDLFLDTAPQQKIINHVSIDRFTGGARDGFLFSEQPIYRGDKIELKLVVAGVDGISVEARTALSRAIDDLVTGQLPLGAGSSRGNGFFNGNVTWSDGGKWIGVVK